MNTENDDKPEKPVEIKNDVPLSGEYLQMANEAKSEAPSDDEKQKKEVPTSELIAPIVAMCAGVLVPNWNLQNEEIQGLSESYGLVIDKYFPSAATSLGVELNALLMTAAIVLPRMGTPRKKSDPDKKTENNTPEKQETGGK